MQQNVAFNHFMLNIRTKLGYSEAAKNWDSISDTYESILQAIATILSRGKLTPSSERRAIRGVYINILQNSVDRELRVLVAWKVLSYDVRLSPSDDIAPSSSQWRSYLQRINLLICLIGIPENNALIRSVRGQVSAHVAWYAHHLKHNCYSSTTICTHYSP